MLYISSDVRGAAIQQTRPNLGLARPPASGIEPYEYCCQKDAYKVRIMPEIHELYDQAEKLKDAGKYEEAVSILEQALGTDETYVLAHLALAVIHGKLGRHDEAIGHGQRACELDPKDPFNFTALSVTYQRASQAVDNATDNQRYIMLAEQAMAMAHQLQGGM